MTLALVVPDPKANGRTDVFPAGVTKITRNVSETDIAVGIFWALQLTAQEAKGALIARLTSTATGSDRQAFELACCDAFAELGFRTRHLGAHA